VGHTKKRKRPDNGTFSHRIDMKFGVTIDWEIFDIYPPKIWRPFEFCVCITANGTQNFKPRAFLATK